MLWPSASLRKDLLLLSKLKKVLLKNPFDTVCTFFSGCVICNVTTFHCLEAPKTSNVEGSNLAWVQIRKKWIKISGRIFLWLFSSIKVQIVHWGKILYKVQFSKVDCMINKLNFLSELDDSTIKQDIDKTFLFFFRFWLNLLTLLNSCVLPWQCHQVWSKNGWKTIKLYY